MRRVAVYGKNVNKEFYSYLKTLLNELVKKGVWLMGEEGFVDLLEREFDCRDFFQDTFSKKSLKFKEVDLLLSIGGDGTFLDTLLYVGNSEIPVLGINSGHLGFLANVSVSEINLAVDYICSGHYEIEQRSLVRLQVEGSGFLGFDYGLNEVSIQKTEHSSLLRIHAYVDDIYLTTYWADGLIIATPTGSTAYSLSGGGPIISPECRAIVLTPVCPHNLSMRSLVIPDTAVLRLEVEGRSGEFLLSLDSRTERVKDNCSIRVIAGDFRMNIIKFPGHNYYETLRNKLGWGEDKRNEKDRKLCLS
ncbi:NAD kinase [Odoribacter lunatus]|uniref:NAD kinase n=1 Tax=Odoribacter lunatus TaxID=2941335 RepID=UPI00204170AC|nr:NAD kinase [Odoribacter lunatus]